MPVAPLIAAFSRRRDVTAEPGWGEDNIVLKLGAKIFAIVGADRLVVKLPKPRVDELVAANSGTRFDPRKNGRVMKEWLVAGRRADAIALAKEAHAFATKSASPPTRPAPRGAAPDPKRKRRA
ncbi:MAG: hypothetical protein ABJE66_14920 [Deltaproteobacteria bacterium]